MLSLTLTWNSPESLTQRWGEDLSPLRHKAAARHALKKVSARNTHSTAAGTPRCHGYRELEKGYPFLCKKIIFSSAADKACRDRQEEEARRAPVVRPRVAP